MQVGTPGPVSAVELADGQIYGRPRLLCPLDDDEIGRRLECRHTVGRTGLRPQRRPKHPLAARSAVACNLVCRY